jgi:antitoxin YefM
MSQSINIASERNQLLQLPEKLDDEPIIITDQDLPIMVAMSYENYISMLETIEILSDSELKEQLMAGIKEDQEGKRVSFDEAMNQLEW